MKKRGFLLYILCAAAALSLSGCQGKAGEQTVGNEAAVSAETTKEEISQVEILPSETRQTEAAEKETAQPEEKNLSPEEKEAAIYENLNWDKMLGETILKANGEHYPGYECAGEGHVILDTELDENVMTVYALTMYGEYQFHNEHQFVKSAGSGVIPCVMEFMVNEKGAYKRKDITWPTDGAGYVESIQELFPEEWWDACITPSDDVKTELTKQERIYAQEYLRSVDRDAQIGDYADFDYVMMTELGVSVEVSNALLKEETWIGNYPSWVGTLETLEHENRYVYERAVDEEAGKIVLTKTEYGSEEPVEIHEFDWQTGEKL